MKPIVPIALLIIWIVIAFQIVIPEPLSPKQIGDVFLWNRLNASIQLNFGLHEYGEENPDPLAEEDRQPRYLEPTCADWEWCIGEGYWDCGFYVKRSYGDYPCTRCHCTAKKFTNGAYITFCSADTLCVSGAGQVVNCQVWRQDPDTNHIVRPYQ